MIFCCTKNKLLPIFHPENKMIWINYNDYQFHYSFFVIMIKLGIKISLK